MLFWNLGSGWCSFCFSVFDKTHTEISWFIEKYVLVIPGAVTLRPEAVNVVLSWDTFTVGVHVLRVL